VEIKAPTTIDEKVTIGKKSKISPHVTIGKHVELSFFAKKRTMRAGAGI
jgi:UDP-3-O-[3-hydroxymyristoyl] glucosamine N-acyltransferase